MVRMTEEEKRKDRKVKPRDFATYILCIYCRSKGGMLRKNKNGLYYHGEGCNKK